MARSTTRLGPWRTFWCLTACVCLVLPTLLGPPVTLLPAAAALAAVLASLVPWPVGRLSPVPSALAAVAVSAAVDVVYAGDEGLTLVWMPFEFAGLLVLTGRLVRRARTRAVALAAAVAALTATALPLRFTLRDPAAGAGEAALVILAALVPVACSVGAGGYLRATDIRRERAVLQARREQRLHVTRVLHDFVAHELTGMVLEVQAAQTAAYDPAEQQALLGRLEQAGLRALDSMDRTLHTLREAEKEDGDRGRREPGPVEAAARMYGVADLAELGRRFAESGAAAGVDVAVEVERGLAGTLPHAVDASAYALVLEALTNIRRHAASVSSVVVTVRRVAGDLLRVSVANDGGNKRLHSGRKGGGTGLAGLEERFTALGGTLAAGPAPDGWVVTGTLPLDGGAGAAAER